jgi:hypothetical protein
VFWSVLSDSSETYDSNSVLTDQQRTCEYKNWLSSLVSKCSNTDSPVDGVAYTETCRELYETWYIVFLVYDLVKKWYKLGLHAHGKDNFNLKKFLFGELHVIMKPITFCSHQSKKNTAENLQ